MTLHVQGVFLDHQVVWVEALPVVAEMTDILRRVWGLTRVCEVGKLVHENSSQLPIFTFVGLVLCCSPASRAWNVVHKLGLDLRVQGRA